MVLDVIIAILFVGLVSMQGAKAGGLTGTSASVRTSYKGKPGFDDFLSRITLYMGIAFMLLTLAVQVLAHRVGPS
jgi:protein translocase SecG subunit